MQGEAWSFPVEVTGKRFSFWWCNRSRH